MRAFKHVTCTLAVLLSAFPALGGPQAKASKTVPAASGSAEPSKTISSPSPEEAKPSKLPIRRVVLYKVGVGYFEHLGLVTGNQTVHIDFTSGQLNDVLQSLTVLDLNGGRIDGVTYNTEAPLGQRLGTLRLPLEENTSVSKFYGALRGARLEIRSGTTKITGRLLSVERKTRVSGGTTLEVDLATLVSDSGEVRSVELTPAVDVRLAEPDVNSEVGRYLSLLSSERQADLRRMNISTAGTGERELYVSYISEVPVWKTTYRVVLPSKPGDQTLLQGWAIVDNTVGEDWDNVELSLVAGVPQSFIEQLAQPYYTTRPVIPLPQNVQLTPQTHEGAMQGGLGGVSGTVTDPSGANVAGAKVSLFDSSGNTVQTTTTDNEGEYSFPDMPAGQYSLTVEKPGFRSTRVQGLSLGGSREQTQNATLAVGSTTETVEVTASSPTVETESAETGAASAGTVGSGAELGGALASRARSGVGYGYGTGGGYPSSPSPPPPAASITAARAGMSAAAQGADLGDLFEYKLKDRVTIHKNESALVPILQTHIDAEKVSLWNDSLNSPRPLRALWLTNTSSLTLDGGSFSVLESEAFAGEGLTDAMKPGEKRLISYAADLGVRVDKKTESDPQRVTRCIINRGTMVQISELRQEAAYTVRDDDTTPRGVIIEHPLRTGWKLSDNGVKPDETTSAVYRFRVNVEPKQTQVLTVDESSPTQVQYAVSNLTSDQIDLFVRQRTINPQIEAALRKIIEQKSRVSALDDEISKRDDERQKIYDDQQRLRENMKALKGSPEERALTQRYTQQLSDQETRLDTLQKESEDLQKQRDAAQAQLDQMVDSLTFDVTL
jgi:hypothetical protein